jgi:hypothetical protein
MKKNHLLGIVVLALAFVGACTPTPGETLPTLAQLPSDSPTQVSQNSDTNIAQRPTLPATFTPTATLTHTPTITATGTPSVTASATITDTPSPTQTDLPTVPPQERPLTGLLEIALQATILPTNYVVPNYEGIEVAIASATVGSTAIPVGTVIAPLATVGNAANCAYFPPAGFGIIYANNPDIASQLGCPSENPPNVLSVPSASENFQTGVMLWLNGEIYALYNTGSYQYFVDTFVAGTDPEFSSEVPPSGLLTPVRGFLKVWSQNAAVRANLGWATSNESGSQASVLYFQNGVMVSLPASGVVWVLIGGRGNGTWRTLVGSA